jgi:hypothetical protein
MTLAMAASSIAKVLGVSISTATMSNSCTMV